MSQLNEMHVPANLFRGPEGVGGHLTVTDTRVFFNPHSLNVQKDELNIGMDEIEYARERKTWKIIPNGMLLRLKSGQEYKFVLNNRKRIIEFINKKVQSC